MYPELLKQWYYSERKKLESLEIFKQEAKMRLLRLKKTVFEKAKNNLTTGEILGRADIADEVKDDLFRDDEKEERFGRWLEDNFEKEMADVGKEEKAELESARYNPEEFAEYLFRLEKVVALENSLSEEGLLPEEIYERQRHYEEKQDRIKTTG